VGKERLAFVTPSEANAIVEALKAIGARHGWHVPFDDPGGMTARANLVFAQWKKLHELGAAHVLDEGAMICWARSQGVIENTMTIGQWKRHELDKAAKKLGTWLRGVLKRRGGGPPGGGDIHAA